MQLTPYGGLLAPGLATTGLGVVKPCQADEARCQPSTASLVTMLPMRVQGRWGPRQHGRRSLAYPARGASIMMAIPVSITATPTRSHT